MTSPFDAIVIGVGGVGSATLYQLASRGLRVLGIDRFQPGHARGSSHGQTRVIRKAYFEHADYVPLLERAYENWFELEQLTAEKLFFQPGLIEVGPADGVLIRGVTRAAELYQLPLQPVERREFTQRFSGFLLPPECVAVFEPDAGYLLVESCVKAYARLAQQRGAILQLGESVIHWTSRRDTVTVDTDYGSYAARNLVITPGAWAGQLLGDLGVDLRVLRKHLHWYAPESPSAYVGGPVFFYETPSGYYYGFPPVDGQGVKVAEHSGGESVADPLTLNPGIDREEQQRVESFIHRHLPAVKLQPLQHATCMYTMTPDEHFIVDRHPQWPNVVFAAGLSGHGFKFASVLGEILANLTMGSDTAQALDFLSVKRFG